MNLQFVTYAVADRIATVTVNRPDKLNALNDAVMADIGAASLDQLIDQLKKDRETVDRILTE